MRRKSSAYRVQPGLLPRPSQQAGVAEPVAERVGAQVVQAAQARRAKGPSAKGSAKGCVVAREPAQEPQAVSQQSEAARQHVSQSASAEVEVAWARAEAEQDCRSRCWAGESP